MARFAAGTTNEGDDMQDPYKHQFRPKQAATFIQDVRFFAAMMLLAYGFYYLSHLAF
jgi:hypothetical protein